MKQKNLKQREATLEEVVNRLAYFTSEFNMPHLFHEGKGRIIEFYLGLCICTRDSLLDDSEK